MKPETYDGNDSVVKQLKRQLLDEENKKYVEIDINPITVAEAVKLEDGSDLETTLTEINDRVADMENQDFAITNEDIEDIMNMVGGL